MSVVDFRSDARISEQDRERLRDYCSDLGGNPVALANSLGVKVFQERLYDDVSGYLEYDPDCGSSSGYKIVLNRLHSIARQQFTLAHELGHFVLHRESEPFRKKREESAQIFSFPSGHRSSDQWHYGDYPQTMEREADAFAATILLPAHLVRKTAEYIEGRPVALAKRLNLSTTFVVRRFEEVRFEL